jgi:hypothetical protein
VVKSLSIGFDPVLWEIEERSLGQLPIRHLKEVRLWEVSCVVFSADPKAKITEVHRRSPHRYTTPHDRAIALADAQVAALALTGRRPLTLEDRDRMLTDASLRMIALQDHGACDTYLHRRAQLERQAQDGSLNAQGLVELRRLKRARGLVHGQAVDVQLTAASAWLGSQSRHPWR